MKKYENSKPKTRKTFRSSLYFRIFLFVIVLILAFIVFAIIRGNLLRADLASDSEAALESKNDAIDAEQQKRLQLFKMQVETKGDSIHTAKYKSCYVVQVSNGILSGGHNNYDCSLHYVSVLELKNQPKKSNDSKPYVPPGANTPRATSPFTAASIEDMINDPNQEVFAEYESRYYLKPSATTASIKDIDNDPWVIASGATIAYAVADAHKNRELLSDNTTGDFQPNRNYVIHTWGKRYFSKDIGCLVSSSLFCSSPI